MKDFYIITNDGKDKDGVITDKVKKILEDNGKTCVLCQKDKEKNIIRESVPENIDCAVVIGGDGSLIEAARALKSGTPILGINMGTLGYLTEIEIAHLEPSMKKILSGEYRIENRMMLEGSFENGASNISLNDIVVSRREELRILRFNLYVNGSLLNSYEADGIIVSTPTGSTAYNLSAGGPIIEPTASIITVTPICPHALLNTRSIVLSSRDEIAIEIGKGRYGRTEKAGVAFDGTDALELQTGDCLKIQRSDTITKLVKLKEVSFLEILRRKMKGN